MSKRPRGELFELFRRSPAETKQHTLWGGIGSGMGDRSGRRRAPILSYAAPVVYAAVLVVLVIIAYAVGYSRGKAHSGMSVPEPEVVSDPESSEIVSETDDDPDVPVVPDAPPAPNEPFWTVRVTSAIPRASAVTLRDDLRAMGYRDVFIYQGHGPTGYTVNAGRFASLSDKAATDLKEEFRKKVYNGERIFHDAYIIKITNLGRIVE